MGIIKTYDWHYTSKNEPRGYIKPHSLQELWFHVGTACNLKCPFCLEGSKPGDKRLQPMTLSDVKPYIDKALTLNVERLSFTGGEPFVIKDFVNILNYAAQHKPCLVLTNGTKPVLQRMQHIKRLANTLHPISFRISIDYPNEEKHEKGRGKNSFKEALEGIRQLTEAGFNVSVARQMNKEEDTSNVNKEYQTLFNTYNIDESTHIVSFPDFSTPFQNSDTPEITENCMTQYHTEEGRKAFMCAYSKMIVKIDNKMRIYACTLVDDNAGYDLGSDLEKSLKERIMMKHHRCYSCFAYGASCSG